MLAVDTNVVVRFLARDDARQTARVDELFATEELLITKTVFLETEWVLRFSYGFDRLRIAAALRSLAGSPTVWVEDGAAVAQALEWFATGMDFADALHVASSESAAKFVTFDKKLAGRAARAGAAPKVALL